MSCAGFRVVQTGLPPRTVFEVEAIDGATGRPLAETDTRSSAAGRLEVRVRAPLRRVRQLHVEVQRTDVHNSEYGEVDADLGPGCRVVGTGPAGPPEPGALQPTGDASRSAPTIALAGAVGLAAVGLAAVVGLRLRRRRR